MKFILSAIGLFLASAGLSLVTVTPAEASCKFPSRIECEGTETTPPPPPPSTNCKFPSYAECKPPVVKVLSDEGEIPEHAVEEEAVPAQTTPALPTKVLKHKKAKRSKHKRYSSLRLG